MSQRSNTLQVAVALAAVVCAPFTASGAALNHAVVSGASGIGNPPMYGTVVLNLELPVMPPVAADKANTIMHLNKLSNVGGAGGGTDEDGYPSPYVSPHACDQGEQADEEKCLRTEGRDCMWTRMETRDMLKPIQSSKALCLPCTLDSEEIPCWNPGAWVNGMQVTDCKMSCMHQKRIWQPQYACIDTTGFISQAQCIDKGTQSGSKCMFIAYEDKNGEVGSSCGPSQLAGSGGWGCPAVGGPGPVAGSKVKSCLNSGAVLCPGPPACPPTVAPPPPPPPPSPGIIKTQSAADEMVSAPAPFLVPTVNPYAIAAATQEAARLAGFTPAPVPPVKSYWPLVYYRQPGDYAYTTGPPPVAGPEPPVLLQGGASLFQASVQSTIDTMNEQKKVRPQAPFLRSLRRQSWGQ